MSECVAAQAARKPEMHWRSLSSVPRDGTPFLGGVWDHTTNGTGYWETIELLQFSPPGTGRLFNLNSGNYTTLLGQLTHWCALAPPPEEEGEPDSEEGRG